MDVFIYGRYGIGLAWLVDNLRLELFDPFSKKIILISSSLPPAHLATPRDNYLSSWLTSLPLATV